MDQSQSSLNRRFNPDDIDIVYDTFMSEVKTVKSNKKIEYINAPCSFDIETSSFYKGPIQDNEKRAIMYEWTLDLNGGVIIGRTWEEFISVYIRLVDLAHLSSDKRLVVYVHNLAFEFQFIRKRLEWDKVFALSQRKPVYALTKEGIEFRCSYVLSGKNLASLGDGLQKYPVKKLVGELDYSLIRHSTTPLAENEIQYCINDVRVVESYIRERIDVDGDISKIPLTKTGYVRKYCRNECMFVGRSHRKGGWKFKMYRELMNSLKIEPDEYTQLKRAFQGGFTHANAFYTGQIMRDVASFDFTSSYPAVMCSEMFPMSSATRITLSSDGQFRDYIKYYCCLFDVEFKNLHPKVFYEHPLSSSRCWKVRKAVEDNGRIVSADSVTTTLTDVDFTIIETFYTWDSMIIGNFKYYRRGYLPRDFITAVLKLYSDKTTLKGVEGREQDYMLAKEMVNSCYGMMVTDICRNDIHYSDGEWSESSADINKSLAEYNKSVQRFLFYPWGVWVTAYARRNLFTGIVECGHDYIYSDTDSIKIINADTHQEYIKKYNERILLKLERAMKFHGLDVDLVKPKTIEGVEKPLGVWDYEGTYTRFKTLGAKRYMTEIDGKINITVSGVNKTSAVPYLIAKYGDKVFDAFTDDLNIPASNDLGVELKTKHGDVVENPCGKNMHTYLDRELKGTVVDYLGNRGSYNELSSTHLEATDYTLSLSSAYIDYILGIQEYER